MKRLLAFCSLLLAGGIAAAGELVVLSYHDVRNDPAELAADPYATSRANLVAHFTWLKENGYAVVDVDALLAAREGRSPLPDKAVLLTFDDGNRSLYTEVFPLLKLFGYPAVAALVTGWQEAPFGEDIAYGDATLPREDFISWREAREMQDSGLVEFASQSHALHHDVDAAPGGLRLPAAANRRWLGEGKGYETLADYYQRIAADAAQSRAVLERRLGRAPRIFVWPYGAHSSVGWQAIAAQGFRLSLTLDDTRAADPAALHTGRQLLVGNPDAAGLAALLLPAPRPQALRAVQVDLDYVYDADPAQQARNLERLVARVRALGLSTVYLQAFADPDGDGAADALYFPNRHLPVRADLFALAAWRLASGAGVRVHAWMPVSAFIAPQAQPDWYVASAGKGAGDPRRLSIFHPQARALVRDIYDDLGRHAWMDGLLFHDDGLLRDDEDSSAAAIAWYEANGFPGFDLARVRGEPASHARWTALKTRALTDFTRELAALVRAHRPEIRTARNLYPRVVLDPLAGRDFAQSLEGFAAAYDTVALMAMPGLDGVAAEAGDDFLRRLAQAVKGSGVDRTRVLFELQARDWRDRSDIPAPRLAAQMDLLLREGITGFGWYPDDFLRDHPAAATVRPAASLSDFPWGP